MLISDPRCGHIFGSKCIAEWLWPTAAGLQPKNTCPVCREVLFSNYDRLSWESASHISSTHETRLSVPLLTSPACGNRPATLDDPVLLARLVEAENRVSASTRGGVGAAAEALALIRVITGELSGSNAGREAADSIPGSVIDDAVHMLAAQLGRLYEYHEEQINEETTSISWDSDSPDVSVLRDPLWARWCEWQLQELVYVERNGASGSLPLW